MRNEDRVGACGRAPPRVWGRGGERARGARDAEEGGLSGLTTGSERDGGMGMGKGGNWKGAEQHPSPGRSLTGKKKVFRYTFFPKSPRANHVLAVGGWWRLAVGGGWWLAVGGPLGRSLRVVLKKIYI